MTIANSVRWPVRRRSFGPRSASYGPPAVLAAAVALGGAAWVYGLGALPVDALLPVICALFLIVAAAIAITWPRTGPHAAGLTYRDVAGLLMLIGILAAAAVEPDQMVRLVEGSKQP